MGFGYECTHRLPLDNVDGTRGAARGSEASRESGFACVVHQCTDALKMLKSSKIVQCSARLPRDRRQSACPFRISRSGRRTAFFREKNAHWTGPPKVQSLSRAHV